MILMTRSTDTVPSGPFQKWIEDRIAFYGRLENTGQPYLSAKRVVQELGWDREARDSGVRRLYRYRHGISETRRGRKNGVGGVNMTVPRSEYPRDVVEDALDHAGGPVLFRLVYPPERFPALYEDIPLEPEMFCANCQDTCSPIRGECPWCSGTLLVRVAA